jgi:hypothetical protein
MVFDLRESPDCDRLYEVGLIMNDFRIRLFHSQISRLVMVSLLVLAWSIPAFCGDPAAQFVIDTGRRFMS